MSKVKTSCIISKYAVTNEVKASVKPLGRELFYGNILCIKGGIAELASPRSSPGKETNYDLTVHDH